MLVETATHLGPAHVLRAEAGTLRVALEDGQVDARLAVAGFYVPQPGDVVLVIGQDEDFYAIGVLHGTGPTVVSVPGDLKLQALNGTVDVCSGRGIELSAPRVRIRANALEIVAQSLVERLGRACRWVRDCFQLRAGRVRARVTEDYDIGAGRIVARAEKDVRLDGEQINLG